MNMTALHLCTCSAPLHLLCTCSAHLYRTSSAQPLHHCTTPAPALHLCTSAPLHLCTSAPLHLCTSVPLNLCPLYLCTSVPAPLHSAHALHHLCCTCSAPHERMSTPRQVGSNCNVPRLRRNSNKCTIRRIYSPVFPAKIWRYLNSNLTTPTTP